MLELRLDPRLPAPVREAYLREARRAGIALADLELLSFDHALVSEFLEAVREKRTAAFMLALDRAHLERAMRRAARGEKRIEVEDVDAVKRDSPLARRS